MVQLAVYATDPDGRKEHVKKPAWPIDEHGDFVEVQLSSKEENDSEVEVKKTGCCSRRCAVICIFLGVLIALGTAGAILGVYYSMGSLCWASECEDAHQHEPQKGDVLYPTPTGSNGGENDDPSGDHHGGKPGRPGHGGDHHGGHTGRPDWDHDHDHGDHHGGRPDPDGDHHGGNTDRPDWDHDHDHGDHHGDHDDWHHGRPRPSRPRPQPTGRPPMRPWP
ncbi:alpha-amylase 4-like [Patiria miniata]|uniref:Uncharacterized protein n=1 Tax=Patiria miniata TaxID=46514 RepID=A0A913ZQ44_PATMI|nr:alpha-amylase 4-like [Patiria miniata]